MPLLVTDYSWTQTESTVYITVPLKGAKAANVDILSTDEYVKVHFPPYLFEAFLFEPVDDLRSTAKVGNGAVMFTLPKRRNKVWEHLMVTTNDKEKKKEIRHQALLQHQDKLSSESRSKAERKQSEKKYTLETMMKLEKEENDSIQKMKDAERDKTTAELAAWQQRAEEARVSLHQSHTTAQAEKRKDEHGSVIMRKQLVNKPCCSDQRGKNQQAGLPAPRRPGDIHVTFTPRVFPTALRESRVQEEEEWLKKQAEARHAGNADGEELKDLEDLKEEQRDPDWLKDKGDKYFAAGNYQSAVNAYSLGIRLNRKIPALYSNRAACHLKLRNLHKAIEDSSQALDLLTPPVAANAAARARASVRRGSAFCQLQLYAEGLQDYQAALRMEPQNEALQADVQRIRSILQGCASKPDTKHL